MKVISKTSLSEDPATGVGVELVEYIAQDGTWNANINLALEFPTEQAAKDHVLGSGLHLLEIKDK